MSLVSRVKNFFNFGGAEGSWRGPFYGNGERGHWFELGSIEDGFQRNLNVGEMRGVPTVYSCVMLNARAMSQCSPRHARKMDGGSYITMTNTPAAHILRNPNSYEHFSQLILNTVAEMLFEGESLWLCLRDDRGAISSVHRMPRRSWGVHIDPDSREVFYALGSQESSLYTSPDYLVPARDVIHFRQHVSSAHPLMGITPLAHAAAAVGINVALSNSQLAFFNNMNRASGILETDENMTLEQKQQARAAFAEQAKHWNQGGIPILSHGVKYKPITVNSNDAQLVEAQKMSIAEIASVFGVPLTLLNQGQDNGSSTEALINHWLSVGLGSLIDTIEKSLSRAFRLAQDERIELEPAPLLRVDFEKRIAAQVKAVQGGIMTPEEIRAKEGLGTKPGADELYMQRQMTAMSTLRELNQAELAGKLSPEPDDTEDDEEEEDEMREFNDIVTKAKLINLLDAKRKSA